MLAQDYEIHKQISWEPHGVVTTVRTYKKNNIQNWLYAQFKCYSTYYLSFSQLSDDSINNVYTEATQANCTTFKNYQWNDSFNIA